MEKLSITSPHWNADALKKSVELALCMIHSGRPIEYWGEDEKAKTLYFRTYQASKSAPNKFICHQTADMLIMQITQWLEQFEAKQGTGDGSYVAGWSLESADPLTLEYDFKISFTTLYYGK